jgi:hypothetical protein
MWTKVLTVVAGLAAGAVAHGDHGHEQEPIAGPHKGLWYNTLPGDGGTQVCGDHFLLFLSPSGIEGLVWRGILVVDCVAVGRFGVFGHLDVWKITIFPVSRER